MSTPRAMTHSSSDLFDRVPILEANDCSSTQKIHLSIFLIAACSEFQFEFDRNIIIDLPELSFFF